MSTVLKHWSFMHQLFVHAIQCVTQGRPHPAAALVTGTTAVEVGWTLWFDSIVAGAGEVSHCSKYSGPAVFVYSAVERQFGKVLGALGSDAMLLC